MRGRESIHPFLPVNYGLIIHSCIASIDETREPLTNNQVSCLPVESSNGDDESHPEHFLECGSTRQDEEVMNVCLAEAEAGQHIHAMAQCQTQEAQPCLHIDFLVT